MRLLLPIIATAALLLAGCTDTQGAPDSAPTQQTTSSEATVPDVTGKALDKARIEIESAGLDLSAEDEADDRGIWSEKNWVVVSQDPAGGELAATGTVVVLKVRKTADSTTGEATPTGIDAKRFDADLREVFGGGSWADICREGADPGAWACWIKQISANGSDSIVITLDTQQRDNDFGEQAARAIFMLVGEDYPELNWVIVENSANVHVAQLNRRSIPYFN